MKILFVEDSVDDLTLMLIEIQQSIPDIHYRQVYTANELQKALKKEQWDIVISDYVMPGFSGLEAVKQVRAFNQYLPIIIVSGTIGEDVAIQALKSGADDYLMKSNLKRLVTAIDRAIKQKKNEFELFQKSEDLELINLLNHAANAGLDFHEIADIFNQRVKKSFNAYAGSLYLLNKDLNKLSVLNIESYSKIIKKIESLTGKKLLDLDIFLTKDSYYTKIIADKKPNLINHKEQIIQVIKDCTKSDVIRQFAPRIYQFIGVNSVITAPLMHNREVFGIIDISSKNQLKHVDISRLKTLQNEISSIMHRKLLEEDLKNAKEKAEESDRLKSRFLANISHEIRTPMNAIVGFAQLIAGKDTDENSKENYAQYIKNNCENLLSTIDNIIDLSKHQAGQLNLYKTEFDIYSALEELLIKYQNHIEEKRLKNLDLKYLVDKKDRKLSIYTDRNRFRKIIDNLLSNAVKYTKKGHVHFGYKITEKSLKLFVYDTGFGIEKSIIDKVYKAFEQYAYRDNEPFEGLGLGLTVTKSFVDELGGEISINSELNKGTRIEIIFPLSIFMGIKHKHSNQKAIPKDYDWSKYQILLADDEEANYILTRRMLKKTKAKIVWVKNGAEAIDAIKNQPEINLVLMDIKMPIMDGYQATREIKKLNKKIPVLAQTAYSMSSEREKSFAAGCDEYFSKPINTENLINTIHHFLIQTA